MDFYNALFSSCVLVFVFANILWGLRVYKLFLILLGLLSGFGLGLLLGDLFVPDSPYMYLWGVGGGLIAALLAWPLQRMFVFVGIGSIAGFIVFSTIMSRSGEPQTGLIAGATVFVIAGFIGVLVYDYFIIILMALVSAYTAINITIIPDQFRAVMEQFLAAGEDIMPVLERYAELHSYLIWPSLFVLTLFVVYSIYMQKILPAREKREEDEIKFQSGLIKKLTFVYSIIIIAVVFANNFLSAGYAVGSLSDWSLAILTVGQISEKLTHPYPVISLSALSLPLSIYVSYHFLVNLAEKFSVTSGKNFLLKAALLGFTLGFIILPLVEMAVLFALMHFENFIVAGNFWIDFYKGFFAGSAYSLAIKWFYSLVIFPGLIVLILPRKGYPIKTSAQSTHPDYCI